MGNHENVQVSQLTTTQQILNQSGIWVTARTYARSRSLTEGTLANWRYRDSRAGRTEAAPGLPKYRRFGRAVRYWMPAETA